jgi:hypothetical protein
MVVKYHKLTTTALTMAQQVLQLESIKWEYLVPVEPQEDTCETHFWFTVHSEEVAAPPICRVMCELLVFRPDQVTECFPGRAELIIEGESTRYYAFHRTKAKKRGYYVFRLPTETTSTEKPPGLALVREQTSKVLTFPQKK